ncbi:NAD(P)/FAD-dependent oxidoreductase [Paractinoplanes atraurantiacus]|uniref:NADH dehydrogenase, FAD-containing subunit n=1 Tax=Paractinoplanes atraurantiacus TaxID=1036182 RepID=A0A285FFZ8_9ACTN|nr:FAD-dependent oxidoreductase [Actinoplanes atraurantiacus]SNY10220.1 NADH dehydrogenase, FAD-containing subunit [Actinoplanes atraurantiacus]
MTERKVVVVGGGYGGIVVAQALDDIADVTVVEPKEMFFHHVAQLRAAADPAWAEKIFFPYDGLLSRGRVIRDTAAEVRPGVVELASGARLDADYVVLATGSTGPFPTRLDHPERDAVAGRLSELHESLDRASGVLLLGAGAIGVEFAGEIAAAWPGKPVTIVDPSDEMFGGRFPEQMRADVARQLGDMGVRVLLGTKLDTAPDVPAGAVRPFTVTTAGGEVLAADLWFACYGGSVPSDYLSAGLASARQPNGRLAVTEHLRVAGQDRVFAVGDLNDTPEIKTGRAASRQAEVAAENIRALIEGGPLTAYEPFQDGIIVTVGPSGGAGYAPEYGFFDAEGASSFKGTFLLDHYRGLFGA